MKYLIRFLFILPVFQSFSQGEVDFSPEEKAYLYHLIRKSPILDTNIGRYVRYQGPVIKYVNREINYDSIENLIIASPDLLLINLPELHKSPQGIIAETVNKMALWELNRTLSARRGNKKDPKLFLEQNQYFDSLLVSKLPFKALQEKNGENLPHPKIYEVLNPQLGFNDKKELLSTLHFLTPDEQLGALLAIGEAVNVYVAIRSQHWYYLLGGTSVRYSNALIAAGDGSPNAGESEDREKDERGRWNLGLPKSTGLFPYQAKLTPADKKNKAKIEAQRFAMLDFQTAGNNQLTIVHPDVWGYKSGKQTTVVIEKNGISYHLFGTEDSRFLSPDSAFGGGATFQKVIYDLEKVKIAKLDEMISGKRGFDYWIAWNTKKRDETELKIEKREKSFSDLGYTPISTSKKAPKSVKKDRRKKKKAGNNQPIDYQPNTYANGEKRSNLQSDIVQLYNDYEMYKRNIAELTKKKQEAIDLRATYQRRLDHYRELLGYTWATYTEKEGYYLFQDSSTFDIYTQEFTFAPSAEPEAFEVRLLTLPEDGLSDVADEVMLHLNVTHAEPGYNARLQIKLNDVFADNSWELKAGMFQTADSVALLQVLQAMTAKKRPFNLKLYANGIAKWSGCEPVKMQQAIELNAYGSGGRDEARFKRLRYSEALFFIDHEVRLEVSAFTDQMKASIEIKNPELLKIKESAKLNHNDLLTAYRVASLIAQVQQDLFAMADQLLKAEESAIVKKKFNAQLKKATVQVGKTSIPLKLFQ